MSKTSTATSNCKYSTCDGSGIIILNTGTAKICECREDKKMESRLKFAAIPKEFRELRVRDFDLSEYKREQNTAALAKKAVVGYVKNFEQFRDKGKGVYLHSHAKGSGKTMLMASMANALMEIHRVNARFITVISLLDAIRDTYSQKAKNSESDLLKAIAEVDVLAMDDIGIEANTRWVEEKLYSILNDRMTAGKVTLFTSNTKIEDLALDERIRSRIDAMVVPVKMPEESVREHKAKAENDELSRLLFG